MNPMPDFNVEQWLKDGKYLPEPMRDFHDQKDLFKAIHETVDMSNVSEYTKGITWASAHVYIIDVFLWYMARRGYTLQKTRTRGQFRDLQTDVEECRQRRNAASAVLLNQEFDRVRKEKESKINDNN
jgi:hypothetical protein